MNGAQAANMASPTLFMVIYVKEQPVRLVFHGTLSEPEQAAIMKEINATGYPALKLRIVEKFKDSDYHYTIFTLDLPYSPDIDRKLNILYPAARKLKLDRKSAIRDAVRSIVLT